MMKQGFRKRYSRLAITSYLLSISYVYFTFTNNRNVFDDESSSEIATSLTEYTSFSKPNRRRDTVDTRFANEASKQRNIKGPKKDYNNSLDRDFSRIPGYIEGSSNSSLFGYVMRDLSNRFLTPLSAQQKKRRLVEGQSSSSNILVVCPGANALLSEIKEKKSITIASKKELIKRYRYRIGESFLVESIFYGHNAIAVDSNTGILDNHGFKSNDILLAIFDPAQGQEDSVISSPLKEYIRSGVIQFATFRISISLWSTALFDDKAIKKNKTEMQGIVSSKIFLDAGYKLQVLSSSHAPKDRLNPYGPNTLFKNIEDVEGFLNFGAGLAQNAQGIYSSKNELKNLTLSSNMTDIPTTFHSILFATRGLDLAIPTRKAFLNLTDYENDHVLDVVKDGVPYLNCPRSSLAATLRFTDDPNSNSDDHNTNGDKFEISCFRRKLLMQETNRRRIHDGNDTILFELWHSHENTSLSEAACLKCTKIMMGNDEENVIESVCVSRILFREKILPDISTQRRSNNRGSNLLTIELKGVNQEMINSSLARFKDFSGNLGLEYFPNFVPSATILNENGDQNWWPLWNNNVVGEDGYQKYRGSNQCDLSFNSNDNNPMLYHGSQIGGMFCFDYDRPNCLSGKHAATHILDHAKKFIKLNRTENERWASYITLIDGVEETETLAGTLDLPLSNFLSDVKAEITSEEWFNTVITIFSNDVEEPILFLKANKNKTSLLKKQKVLFTSDLHHIMRSKKSTSDIGNTLRIDLLPEHATMIDRSVKAGGHNEFRFNEGEIVAPPSILSFYADIPKERKFQLIKPRSKWPTKRAMVLEWCRCATTFSSWFDCRRHPWNTEGFQDERDTFILVDCPGQPIHLEINMIRNENLLQRKEEKKEIRKKDTSIPLTNLIFLELDSVSIEYADRHFPKTRELLKKYRIKRNGENEYECTHGICSAEFPYTALVGANSIPNQVAALSGCISTTTHEFCGLVNASLGDICNDVDMMHHGLQLQRIREKSELAYWCPIRDKKLRKTPWLFGVSDSKGYINFFGEEFCYDESPYVTQGNVFPKWYHDIESHHVFCKLVDRKISKEKLLVHRKNRWGVDISDPCIEGYACSKNAEKSAISLQFMEQMWNTYVSHPKLAFLNAMAAHEYSPHWEMMIPKAEAYDEQIYNFLEAMLSRSDSEHTVIIIRSDHGLQKGPMSMDYSLQVEHRHPWTEVLVPQNLVVSKSALFNNQARMLTGYDLYRTMRFLMSDRKDTRNLESGIPDWAFDILAEEISENRTCEEAKADPNLCRTVKQTRQYGVCNYLDSSQARFCQIDRISQRTNKTFQ